MINHKPVIIKDTKLPLISIVTPSYNQGIFLEETINSVLNQNYPNIEYWIIDAESSDTTYQVIEKYKEDPRFNFLIEEDKGQSDAINKGWQMCRGDIFAWLNSDDIYAENIFTDIAHCFSGETNVVFGNINIVDQNSTLILSNKKYSRVGKSKSINQILHSLYFPYQPSTFFRRSALEKFNFLNDKYHYVMDVDIIMKLLLLGNFCYVDKILSSFRIHPDSKTSNYDIKFAEELLILSEKFCSEYHQFTGIKLMEIEKELESFFYRRAGKHFSFAGDTSKSFSCILRAIKASPHTLIYSLYNDFPKLIARYLLTYTSSKK
jgi:glycosyltransferase involved in cell wall biosynthesis